MGADWCKGVLTFRINSTRILNKENDHVIISIFTDVNLVNKIYC